MRSRIVFLVLTVAVAVSVVGLIIGLSSDLEGRGQGMGWMGGGTSRSLWVALIAVPLVIVVAVLGYAALFPELSEKTADPELSAAPAVEKGESVVDAVLRVLKDDERKVVETLVEEDGKMLQKDIRWKTGFSRVKTHRILFRLAERGIVTAEKYHNTNKITLADWLMEEKSQDLSQS
jgi:hypothetical protein